MSLSSKAAMEMRPMPWGTLMADMARSSDFDGDGIVNFQDFLEFAKNFGKKQGDTDFDADYDLNGDREVNFPDFLQFAQVFGQKIV